MEIKLLYFDGCPSWQNALTRLQRIIKDEGLDFPVNLIEVKSDMEAMTDKFLGSPSFQVNGRDLWPEDRDSYSKCCRIYNTPQGLIGWPTDSMLRQRLLELKKEMDQSK
jgi:hypothetical protein